jgi:hypothetical protein
MHGLRGFGDRLIGSHPYLTNLYFPSSLIRGGCLVYCCSLFDYDLDIMCAPSWCFIVDDGHQDATLVMKTKTSLIYGAFVKFH